MAWCAPVLLDCPPGASEEMQREWWERNRKIHNKFAEQFNRDWLNRLFKLKIDMMPGFDDIEALKAYQ